ncbi:basic amino acid ABC transporter substrate-binding protein [Paenibacillus mucilaginosus]|uniref:ABC-type glutamine transport system, periplasmic-binding component n=1 Tax=Paenibacillus mucilaginosus (strain KNP414) TaxID=1036673 RepID=F8FKL4_PAEMK|nr:basic amino acid ABC transporter substrate-binding protein [Paenibacillus mucilaginosus]AEI45607.1 ABC-type glutamine transport system, periplasmic-binding component [Paenibacillus mucilaginosus KNP414]MCG7215353.1 basic amino acid ABC transporter substrate-binding protein [Paenibacillus mucilaginosus]WDM27013.1 basic amino acid ABC transporter substrate-binding protein [Paenibacillus mucilaginosus]
MRLKSVLTLMTLTTFLFTAACGTESATTGSGTSSGSGAAGGEVTYKIATDASYAPMEYMDKDKITGFDIDFLAEVMKEAGLKYEVTNVGWDTMLESVKQGKEYHAGISSVSITDERKQTYDYSIPYFESTNMILVKEGSPVKSADDLKGKKVAVQGATTADTIMSGILGKDSTDLKRFESNALALMELDSGGVEAVVADIAIVREYIKNNPNKKYQSVRDEKNFQAEYYGILYPKGSELKAKLDPAVKKVLENGKFAEVYKKWFGEEPNVKKLLEAAAK